MQIVGLSEAKENEYLEDLYNCFESGYPFDDGSVLCFEGN